MADFKIGRAVLSYGGSRNGVTGAPEVKNQAGDVVEISGVYTPDLSDATAVQLAKSDAFRQQWLGMPESADRTVPISAPARFQMDGFWFPVSTSISDIPGVTDGRGVLGFSGQFRRLFPSYAQAGQGFSGVLGNRSTGVHAVVPRGTLWYPAVTLWKEAFTFANGEGIKVDVDGSTRFIGYYQFASGDVGSGILKHLAFAVDPIDVYNGAATVERKGSDGNWYPIHGRQLVDVSDPADVRIGNGLVRATYQADVGEKVDVGYIAMEAFSQSSETWTTVGEWVPQPLLRPSATPSVQMESAEQVTLRYPVRERNLTASSFVTLTCKRGARWIELDWDAPSSVPATVYIEERTQPSAIQLTGGLNQTALGPGGHKWLSLSPYEQPGFTNPAIGSLAVDGANVHAAIGAVIDAATSQTHLDFADVRDDYWKIVAAVSTPIAL